MRSRLRWRHLRAISRFFSSRLCRFSQSLWSMPDALWARVVVLSDLTLPASSPPNPTLLCWPEAGPIAPRPWRVRIMSGGTASPRRSPP